MFSVCTREVLGALISNYRTKITLPKSVSNYFGNVFVTKGCISPMFRPPEAHLAEKSRAQKEPQSQNIALTVPKNFLNNLRTLPNKRSVLKQIAPEGSPESWAKSLPHKFLGVPFLSIMKIAPESRLEASMQERALQSTDGMVQYVKDRSNVRGQLELAKGHLSEKP